MPELTASSSSGEQAASSGQSQRQSQAHMRENQTVASLLARVTALELENGRLRGSGRNRVISTVTDDSSPRAAAGVDAGLDLDASLGDSATSAPSIEPPSLENSMELALSQCWVASGAAEGVSPRDEDGDSDDVMATKPDVALLVERISNSRSALQKAESRLAAQTTEVATHVEAQEQLTRELHRLQETDGKYRSFVSAVLRAEQAAARTAAAAVAAGEGGSGRGLSGLTRSPSPPLGETAAAVLSAAAAGGATPPPRIDLDPVNDSAEPLQPPPPPTASPRGRTGFVSQQVSVIGGGRLEPDQVASPRPAGAAAGSDSSEASSSESAGERRGSGGVDWLETLAETVCQKLYDSAVTVVAQPPQQQDLSADSETAAAAAGEENYSIGLAGAGAGTGLGLGGGAEGCLAYNSVDMNDLVMFYPVVVGGTGALVGDDGILRTDSSGGDGGAEVAAVSLSPRGSPPECVWQALLSGECGDGLPHYLNTESLVRTATPHTAARHTLLDHTSLGHTANQHRCRLCCYRTRRHWVTASMRSSAASRCRGVLNPPRLHPRCRRQLGCSSCSCREHPVGLHRA